MSDNMTTVFLMGFRVSPLENSIMPEGMSGAYVRCYSGLEKFEDALNSAMEKLQSDGLFPEEVLDPIHQMDSSEWSLHVDDNYYEHANSLPTQKEFVQAIESGKVVYGPFGGYNQDL